MGGLGTRQAQLPEYGVCSKRAGFEQGFLEVAQGALQLSPPQRSRTAGPPVRNRRAIGSDPSRMPYWATLQKSRDRRVRASAVISRPPSCWGNHDVLMQ